MRTIWRYNISFYGNVVAQIALPIGAKIVHVEIPPKAKEFTVSFWVHIPNTDFDRKARTFELIGTGQPIPENATYHGTAAVEDNLVLHLFELAE